MFDAKTRLILALVSVKPAWLDSSFTDAGVSVPCSATYHTEIEVFALSGINSRLSSTDEVGWSVHISK